VGAELDFVCEAREVPTIAMLPRLIKNPKLKKAPKLRYKQCNAKYTAVTLSNSLSNKKLYEGLRSQVRQSIPRVTQNSAVKRELAKLCNGVTQTRTCY